MFESYPSSAWCMDELPVHITWNQTCTTTHYQKQVCTFFCDVQPQEIYFYVGRGDLIRNEDLTQETTSAEIADKGNKELIESLTTADGMLGAGLQPAVRTANEEGTKVLLETILHDSKVEKAKKKTKKDTEKTEKVEPQTLEEPLGLFTYGVLNPTPHQRQTSKPAKFDRHRHSNLMWNTFILRSIKYVLVFRMGISVCMRGRWNIQPQPHTT